MLASVNCPEESVARSSFPTNLAILIKHVHRQISVLLHPLPDDEPDGIVAGFAELASQIPESFFNVIVEGDRARVSQQQRAGSM